MVHKSEHELSWATQFTLSPPSKSSLLAPIKSKSLNKIFSHPYKQTVEAFQILYRHSHHIHAIPVVTNQLSLAQSFNSNEWLAFTHLQLAAIYDLLRLETKCVEHLELSKSFLQPSREFIESLTLSAETNINNEKHRVAVIVDGWLNTAKYLHQFGRNNLTQGLLKLSRHFIQKLIDNENVITDNKDLTFPLFCQSLLQSYQRLNSYLLRDEFEFDASLSSSLTVVSSVFDHFQWRNDFDTVINVMESIHNKNHESNRNTNNNEFFYQQLQLILNKTIKPFQSAIQQIDNTKNDNTLNSFHCNIIHAKLIIAKTILNNELKQIHSNTQLNYEQCQLSLSSMNSCVNQLNELFLSSFDSEIENELIYCLILLGQQQFSFASSNKNMKITLEEKISLFESSIQSLEKAAKFLSVKFIKMTNSFTSLTLTIDVNECSHPLQRSWAKAESFKSQVQFHLWKLIEREPVMTPNTDNLSIDTKTVNYQILKQSDVDDQELSRIENELLSSWENKYSDVFHDLQLPSLSQIPYKALESAALANFLLPDAERSLTLGIAQLNIFIQHNERERLEKVTKEKLEKREKEKELWKKQIYGIDKEEEKLRKEEEEKQKLLEEEEKEKERIRLEEEAIIKAEEEEQERQRLEEEERAAAAKGKVKGKLPPPAAAAKNTKTSSIPPAAAVTTTDSAVTKKSSADSNETNSPDDVDPVAESFSYDSTEWSPYHLYCWLTDLDRERAELRGGHHREKSQLTARLKRQQSNSAASIDELNNNNDNDDDALDPTILLDNEFNSFSLANLSYQNLISSLNISLLNHQFDLISLSSLSLIKLFTTHQPILSSKYLALYLSAKVSQKINLFISTIGKSNEIIIKNKYSQLLNSEYNYCNKQMKEKCFEWFDDTEETSASLIHPWSALIWPMEEAENDGDEEPGPLKGYDAIYASMLVAIPSSVSLLTILYEPDDHAIYISLIASTGFPLSSRFSRTVLTPEQESILLNCQTFFNQFDEKIEPLLAAASATSNSPLLNENEAAFQSLESEYLTQLRFFSELLIEPIRRALITDSTLAERDLILLTDELMFRIPFESLTCFKNCKSICRDFSLSSFYQRLQSSSAEPCNRKSLSLIIHGNHYDTNNEIDLLYESATPLINIANKIIHERERSATTTLSQSSVFTTNDYLQSFINAKNSGAIIDFGYNKISSNLNIARDISGVDLRGVRLAVLMAKTFNNNETNYNNKISSYYQSLLLSCRGINTLLLSDHCQSECINATQMKLVSLSLASGQSIASCLKQIQLCNEIVPSISFALSRSQSPIQSRSASRVSSPRRATKGNFFSPSRASAVKSPKFGSQQSPNLPAINIRSFDRFNSVIVGLPHWRL